MYTQILSIKATSLPEETKQTLENLIGIELDSIVVLLEGSIDATCEEIVVIDDIKVLYYIDYCDFNGKVSLEKEVLVIDCLYEYCYKTLLNLYEIA